MVVISKNALAQKALVKHMLAGGSSLAALALAVPATVQAQETVATPASAQTAEEAEIVVTGTRIAMPEADQAYPVLTVTDEAIQRSGETNLTELLAELPALTGSLTSQRTAGSLPAAGEAGMNFLNLRNLGADRTLVLVNGRRHVSSSAGTAAVDINTIPVDLVERIDVLTGGVSPIYGADGVSGVVNFVLKRDFEGIEANLQNGVSSRGDAAERYASIVAGKNFAGGAGNVALSYEYRHSGRVTGDARRSGRPNDFFVFRPNPADRPDSPGLPDRIPFNDLRYFGFSAAGAADVNIDGLPDFLGTGGVYSRGTIIPNGGGLAQGGDSTPVAAYGGDLQPSVSTHNINLLASYEVSPALRLYAEGKFVSVRSFTQSQPTRDAGILIVASNPYIPDAIRAAIIPGRVAAALGAPPGAVPDGFAYSRDNYDFGLRGQRNKRETVRGVIGVDGEISDHARYDLSYTYGRTTNDFTDFNYRITDRYFAALDAARAPDGSIVCRSTLNANATRADLNYRAPAVTFTPGAGSACRPVNLFGGNTANQAALDFFLTDLKSRVRLTQHVVGGSVSGDFGEYFELPGGPVGFAIGGEYRKESSSFTPDALLEAGRILDRTAVKALSGSYDVKEGFAELQVPVLRDRPGAQLLQFGAAIRVSDYSTAGSTTTWKVDGTYAPVRDVRVRGTYSHSVRAPNIGELFNPDTGSTATILDPCSTLRTANGTQYRAANCATLLSGLGINPATFNPDASPASRASIPGIASGNGDLREETAKTWTAGVEVRPSMIPGLVASIDWYDIKLTNAISTPTAQQLVNLCVDQPTLANPFCANVTRNTAAGATAGFITGFRVNPENVTRFSSSGADFKIFYAFEPDARYGRFDVRLAGGYLDKSTTISLPGAPEVDELRQRYRPKWSGNLDLAWTLDNVTVNYGINYFGKTLRFTAQELAAQPDLVAPEYRFWNERWEHDLQIAVSAYEDRATFYAGVNNLFDRQPDFDQVNYPASFRGRFLYAGIRARLD